MSGAAALAIVNIRGPAAGPAIDIGGNARMGGVCSPFIYIPRQMAISATQCTAASERLAWAG